LFNPSSGITEEILNYTGADATGTLTDQTNYYTAGGSQQQFFTGLSTGTTEEVFDYSGAGTLLDTTYDFTAGNSQEEFFYPQADINVEIVNWSGLNDTGQVTTAKLFLTNGNFIYDSFYYDTSGVETYMSQEVYTGPSYSGPLVGTANFDSAGQYISGSGSGGYYAYQPVDSGGGAYAIAAGMVAPSAALGSNITAIGRFDANNSNHTGTAVVAAALYPASSIASPQTALAAGGAVLAGAAWDTQAVALSTAISLGTKVAPSSGDMGSAIGWGVKQAFAGLAKTSGLSRWVATGTAQALSHTLDSTDFAGISELYASVGASEGATAHSASSVDQLIQAMATFDSSHSAAVTAFVPRSVMAPTNTLTASVQMH
jgi:hypothetical protein